MIIQHSYAYQVDDNSHGLKNNPEYSLLVIPQHFKLEEMRTSTN